MIKLKQCTETFGDCTAGYEVTLTKKYFVKEFVDEVVSNEREWGYIGIKNEKYWSVFGDPNCEYKRGKLISSLPDEYLDKEILSAKAVGGYSRMDYLLEVEQLANKKN